MGKHRAFNADRFLDKLHGHENLLREYVGRWNGRLDVKADEIDVPRFKEFLVDGNGDGRDDLIEGLYRVYDLCTERGHEDLIAACGETDGYCPDPEGKLPVECLSLKVRTENEDAFNLAYDRNTLWNAERFSLYLGKEPRVIADIALAQRCFQTKLAEAFKDDKSSDRVLVRHYREGSYTNFIVYHEKRTTAQLVFKGSKTRTTVSPMILRPAQQDFVSYDHNTGQVEIEARFEHEEAALRRQFADCFLGDTEFFEGTNAAKRFTLARIADEDFSLPVDEDHTAVLAELHFNLMQKHGPSFSVRSKDTLETLDLNYLRKRLPGGTIKRAVFKITFPDDRRGKRVELADQNKLKFKRATHAEDVFRYLKNWGLLVE